MIDITILYEDLSTLMDHNAADRIVLVSGPDVIECFQRTEQRDAPTGQDALFSCRTAPA